MDMWNLCIYGIYGLHWLLSCGPSEAERCEREVISVVITIITNVIKSPVRIFVTVLFYKI